jgi:hypothetical protein
VSGDKLTPLPTLVAEAVAALHGDGLGAQVLRTAPAFGELRVSEGAATCIVDLVAERDRRSAISRT